jgi:uncharacterized metal-binding protein
MEMRLKCTCSGAPDLMFSCSGAADTAEIADRAVRQLHREGAAKMFCLAGIGGRVELILLNTQAAGSIVTVDGCDTDCAKRTLERAGFKNFTHIRVTDLGMEKGNTEVTPERIDAVAARVRDALGASTTRTDL